ncbi:Peptidase inhibitor I78 family protein [Streptomyces sp. 2112.3]|nr:peptidase inhibitor I78 family protein [Streptomyces sp. 2321.6]SDR54107.1 Peptidase inhibitor I78 family protein [Streptomyces sp. KS_16]SEC21854.1 Peptidase inhibitor I78 family protein [Streptomyces sp. 2133.1]SEF06636.1 Peptidase inhibitor I78 family protein [Streptomyces sp. 2112.3]SNC65916.1 Peptidase inhibitor I78 family protein [Streptomyces sp. 2114.4]
MRGPGFRGPARTPTVAVMADVPNLPDNPQDDIEAYVGLAQQDAEEQARGRGWTTVRSLPPGAIITMEYLAGRLNFEVKDGTVHRTWQG